MWSLLKLNNVDFHNQNKTKQKQFKSVKRPKMPQSWPELYEQSKTLWNGNRKWFIFQWKSSIGKIIAEIVHANVARSDRVGRVGIALNVCIVAFDIKALKTQQPKAMSITDRW